MWSNVPHDVVPGTAWMGVGWGGSAGVSLTEAGGFRLRRQLGTLARENTTTLLEVWMLHACNSTMSMFCELLSNPQINI